MENVIITNLGKYSKIVPNEGYILYHKFNQQYYSQAVTKDINLYEAVVKEGVQVEHSPEPEPSDPLAIAKVNKIAEISSYDTSSAVNAIEVNGVDLWIPAEQRAILKTSVDAYKALGQENVTKVWNGVEYTATADQWLYMINTVEVYASECFNVTARHKVAVNALTTVAEIEAYDYHVGYPEKLVFNL